MGRGRCRRGERCRTAGEIDRLTFWDGAAHPSSLKVVLVGALIVLPFIVAYTAFAYYVFRSKARTGLYDQGLCQLSTNRTSSGARVLNANSEIRPRTCRTKLLKPRSPFTPGHDGLPSLRRNSLFRNVRQRTDCQMIAAHNFTLLLGGGAMNNCHLPAAALHHVLQRFELRALMIVQSSCGPRDGKRTAPDTRPTLFDNTGGAHDSDTRKTFRQDFLAKQCEYFASAQE